MLEMMSTSNDAAANVHLSISDCHAWQLSGGLLVHVIEHSAGVEATEWHQAAAGLSSMTATNEAAAAAAAAAALSSSGL